MIKENNPIGNIELAVIGYCLSGNNALDDISFLRHQDFQLRPHQCLFKAIRTVHDSGKKPSPFNVFLPPEEEVLFSAAGGVKSYLAASLRETIGYPFPIENARLVANYASKRDLIEKANNFISRLNFNACDPEKEVREFIEEIGKSSGDSDILSHIHDNMEITDNIIKSLNDKRKPYSTGITRLDTVMGGGLHQGKCYGFAARKKQGKTILAGTIAHNLNCQNIPHLFICGEMSSEEVHERVLARLTGSYTNVFRSSYGQSYNFQDKLINATSTANRATFYYDAPGLTFDKLKAVCKAAVKSRKVRGVVLDYWQLVGGKEPKKSTSEHLDEVAQWLADFARQRGVWMIVMAQINQDGNTRGSEGIRLAFDQVYHLHREDISQPSAWLEMLETRYTEWANVGDKCNGGLYLEEKGLYFRDAMIGEC